MTELQIQTRWVDGVPEVWLLGELDLQSAPRVREALAALLDTEPPLVRVRLSGLQYIDSTGLGVVVGALKRTNDLAGALVLVQPSPQVAHVLQVTGLDKIFTVLTDPTTTLPSSPVAPS